ncbi:MAG: molybdate ABC transporter permease subunit [Acidobacteriota bacterium]
MDGTLIQPLLLSLRVSLLASLVVVPLGTLLGLLLSRSRFPGRSLLEGFLMLPLVLPPTVTGSYLIVLLGRSGPVGSLWHRLTEGSIPFTWQAASIAAAIISLPIMVRSASAALGAVDRQLEEASYCLGKTRVETFWRVSLPLASRGLLAGAVLSFSRALGEFGATLLLAGNIPGRTQTMPLAIYEAVAAGEDERARVLALLLTVVSIVVVMLAARFEPARP